MIEDPYLRIAVNLGERCISIALLADGAAEIDKSVNALKIFMGPFIEALSMNQPPEYTRRIREYFTSLYYGGTPDVNREDLRGLFLDASQPASPEQMWMTHLAMLRNDLRVPRPELVLRAAVINCASIIESVIASLAYEIIAAQPKLAITGMAEFHLSEILEYASLQEFIVSVAENHAEELVRKGSPAWQKWFKDKVKNGPLIEDVSWDDIQEVREVWNCIVHHDARISKQYARWSHSRNGQVTVGDQLRIDRNMVAFCISTAYVSCQLLIWGTAHKFSQSTAHRWELALKLSASDLIRLSRVSGITDDTIAAIRGTLAKL